MNAIDEIVSTTKVYFKNHLHQSCTNYGQFLHLAIFDYLKNYFVFSEVYLGISTVYSISGKLCSKYLCHRDDDVVLQ